MIRLVIAALADLKTTMSVSRRRRVMNERPARSWCSCRHKDRKTPPSRCLLVAGDTPITMSNGQGLRLPSRPRK